MKLKWKRCLKLVRHVSLYQLSSSEKAFNGMRKNVFRIVKSFLMLVFYETYYV